MISNQDISSENPRQTPPRGRPSHDRQSEQTQNRNHNRNNQSSRRGRSRGGDRGRGGRGRGHHFESQSSTREVPVSLPPNELPPPLLAQEDIHSDQLVVVVKKDDDENAEKRRAEDVENGDDDTNLCFICASPVVHHSVAPCNHRTCHICSLRLRALYKTKACAHCRTPSDVVLFTDDPTKRYEAFTQNDVFRVDNVLGIRYTSSEIYEDTVLLLRYNCPDPNCDVACLSWPDLHRHVKSTHGKVMCDLCTRNKKVFTHEHDLYTPAELRKHHKFGDDNPGATDQTGFKGHPECGFCRSRFYGDDELYTHCREKHERCHICDRRNQTGNPVYYLNYDSLEDHFRKDHFLCPDRECLEKKFVVFESELDLQAHQVSTHPNGLTRDARRVDMSSFSFRDAYVPGRRGGEYQEQQDRGNRGRGRGRGRDPNAEALPPSSAQPLRRDELAFQRQMAVQTAQSVTPRTFRGQITPSANESVVPANEQRPVPASRQQAAQTADFPTLAPLSSALGSTATTPVQISPAEQTRRLRHTAVTERASTLLRNDAKKLDEFRFMISAFKSSAITAAELIEAFVSLFDSSSADLGKLVKELAEIFEIPSKRDELLKAWNDWKAINEDYPSLPGSSSESSSTAAAAHGNKRVLKLKSLTAQSSRSPVSRTGSWGTTNVNNLFPSLAATLASANRAGPGRTPATPWAAPSAAPAPSSAASRSSARPASNNGGLNSADAFPALPVAAKPTSSVFSPGYTGSGVRRDDGFRGPIASAWGGGGSGGTVTPIDETDLAEGETGAAQKRKGNKNKKQTLIHFG